MLSTNWLKGNIILIVVLITTINISFSQSYYHSPNDTIIGNAPFDDVSVFNITQVHPTADTIYFKWQKQSVDMPPAWEASICDVGHCYTFLGDTGTMDPIVTGDNGLMSLHIDPKFAVGTGIIRYSIFATNSPTQIDTLTWIITATVPNGVDRIGTPQPIICYSNQQIICRNVLGKFSKAFLYDLSGKLLMEKDIQSEEATLDVHEFTPQLLILRLAGQQNLVDKIFNY